MLINDVIILHRASEAVNAKAHCWKAVEIRYECNNIIYISKHTQNNSFYLRMMT